MQKTPSNKLAVYLIKEEFTDHAAILKKHDTLQTKTVDDVGVFYYGDSHNYKPSWLKKFFGSVLGEINLFNAVSRALLLLEVPVSSDKKRIFAIPFGYGWTMMIPGIWEERFGLRTTLNMIAPDTIRKIDKKSMASVPKDTSEQLSRAGIAADFGIDIEQDLIRSITGGSKSELFGKTVTGNDALHVSAKIDLTGISNFLKQCYEKFLSEEYKKDFAWIDQIAEVKDPKTKLELNGKLIGNIKANNLDKTWLAVPEIVEWEDVAGFSYDGNKDDLKEDISFDDYLSSLSDEEKSNISLEKLKQDEVTCFATSNDEIKYHWKIYKCVYCEIVDDVKKKTFLLSNGKWFEIEKEFSEQVNTEYAEIKKANAPITLPSYSQKNENEYNKAVATQDSDFCCMDRENISHGGGHSKIEFCDLYTKDKTIIHVKHYGGSSVLSHLFAQGVVSGELFLADSKFREKVNDKLSQSHKIQDTKIKPTASDYTIIYGIISSSGHDLEIPFFSKVSLKNAKRRLETFGYKVFVQKIGHSADVVSE
ncbi:MAG: TIGR04141 family sporadically distributed protein [Candidatus Paceibacterota bacterium]